MDAALYKFIAGEKIKHACLVKIKENMLGQMIKSRIPLREFLFFFFK